MLRSDSGLNTLLIALALALAIAYYVPRHVGPKATVATEPATAVAPRPSTPGAVTASAPVTNAAAAWAAAAPGRVEPGSGEIRLTTQAPGRIVEVLAAINDKVTAGDLLMRLDDTDAEARVAAAEAEVNVRRRERDGETVSGLARDRRTAEDAVASAERLLAQNRAEFDRWLRARKAGTATNTEELEKARETVKTAADRLETAKTNLRRLLTSNTMPMQTRLEAGIAAARSELSLAEAALERTRVRAPRSGSVLLVNAVVGETAAPSPEAVQIVLGDTSSLRVRSEIEERDVGKVRIGQNAIVRSDAFPGRDFTGKVSSMAQVLGPGKLGQKGPRKPNDVDVMEILIDLTGQPPLLSGMRVDVFLKPDETAASGQSKSN
jgi:HlyD family secretion protein